MCIKQKTHYPKVLQAAPKQAAQVAGSNGAKGRRLETSLYGLRGNRARDADVPELEFDTAFMIKCKVPRDLGE